MPEPVFYLRGFPNFAEPDSQNPAMVADLKAISELSERQVSQMVAGLKATSGFLDPKKLVALVRGIVSENRAVRAVQRALQNLEPNDVDRVLDVIDERREADDEVEIDDEGMVALRRNLTALIQVYPALARFEKAQRLSTLTGQQLESIELICDLRPIFDDSRKGIEGMMPYTRLRLVATGADGLPRMFEAELSVEQVHDLSDTVEKAKAKLTALREAVETWLPDGIPDLPATRVPRKESSNA